MAPRKLNAGTAPDRAVVASSVARDGSVFFLEKEGTVQTLYRLADAEQQGEPINKEELHVSAFALAYP
jgi:hypothetical protein